MDGIRVVRVWTYIAANEGFVKRSGLHLLCRHVLLGWAVHSDGCHRRHISQFFTAVAGRALSAVKFKPWVMEVRDLWPNPLLRLEHERGQGVSLPGMGGNEPLPLCPKNHRGHRCVQGQNCSRGIDASKIDVHKNGVILDLFTPREKDSELLSLHPQLESKQVFAYIGTHGMAHALAFILDCLPKAQTQLPQAHFLFIGEGAEKKTLGPTKR